jgi:ketosteroid isomerase-like protein
MADTAFETPEAAEDAFYRAFAATDLTAMAGVWNNGDDARCIHPGGDLLSGAAAVLGSWREIFAGASAPRVQARLLHRSGTGDLRIHLVEEGIGPREAGDGGLTRILATNVYRRTENGWRMVLHHATLPLMERTPGGSGKGAPEGGRLH